MRRSSVTSSSRPVNGYGLEAEERDDLRVIERETNYRAHLLIVDSIDDRDDRHDLHTRIVQVVDGLEFHVEQVADQPVRIGFVSDSIELQVRIPHARFGGLAAELGALRELDAVRCGLNAVVAHLHGISYGVEEVRRQRGLATGELDRHLTARLDRDRVVEHRLDVFPRELVDEADLVGIHEARVAHHVATVSQVDGQHRPAAVLHRARTVVVELFVVVRADVAAGEALFQVLEERRVDRHDVFEVAVLRAVLHHQDLAVALDDGGFDLANLFIQQDFVRQLAVDNLLPDLRYAAGAERVGLTRPAQWRLRLFPGLEQRLF
jgi:hypothetical protein